MPDRQRHQREVQAFLQKHLRSTFDPSTFAEWLADFRAAFAGEENPEGYED
jgi:hypothetical protein